MTTFTGGGAPHRTVIERVLEVVEQIPPGLVLTYGDVADLAECSSARGVGRIMAHYGAEVPWWRVVNASGRPPPHHLDEAIRRLSAEGAPLSSNGARVHLAAARWLGRPRTDGLFVSEPLGPLPSQQPSGGTPG
ncbi:MAG: MGMT family protein [Candidatus Nanopelagicales bacterium]